jgi:crotonobetainyl-CoA:carnitine CoA-transferase CaiB-like acyl-CoA transferase
MATEERANAQMDSSITSSERAGRVLRGLRVLDLASDAPGRYCARLLADAGAEVIRLIPSARPERGPALATEKALQLYVDRGKMLVRRHSEADLGSLCSAADVIVHDSLYGDSPWKLDFDGLRERHPGLISLSITPFGESGPQAGWKGDDLIAVGTGGLAHATPGLPDFSKDLDEEPPLRPDALVGELVSGLHGAVGVLLALFARAQDGRGQHVEVSMQQVVAALMPWDINLWTFGRTIVGRQQVRAHLAPNSYLPGGDNWFVIVAFTEAHWQSLLEIMGNPDWAESELFANGIARGENSDALEPLLVDWLKTQSPWKFLEEVQKRGVPSTPALELPDALKNDHIRSRSVLVKTTLESHGETVLPGDVFIINGRRRDALPGPREASLESLTESWTSSLGGSRVSSDGGRLPLEGVRIVDFSQFVAMPLAGEWLALMGAEVLLIESRTSLLSRRWAPFAGEPSPDTCGLFINLNLGKKSVTINLRTAEGIDLAKRLIGQADMVLENFSPGTMQKLGLGYEELRRIKDDISMVSLPAFGSTGPWRNYVSFHSGVAALSGFAAVTGYEGSHPRIVGAVTPDTIAASYCLLAALQALHHQRKTSKGLHIEIAMSETLQSLMPEAIAAYGLAGEAERRLGNRHRWKSPHGIYRCKGDDAWVAISVANDEQWNGLCHVLGRPALAGQYGSAEKRKYAEPTLDILIRDWTSGLTPDEAAARLQEAGVPAGKVANARDLVEDPHLLQRGAVVTVTHPKAGPHPVIGVPWHLHLAPPVVYRHAPLVGDGNEYAFGKLLGLTDAEIAKLVEAQVIH